MANGTNQVDFSIPLATFLATIPPGQVAGQTYAQVLQALKFDRTGFEANAAQQAANEGQLTGNVRDDFFLTIYGLLQGARVLGITTTDATVSDVTLATLAVDGDATFIEARVSQRQTTGSNNLTTGSVGGMFYRTAGAVQVLDPTKTIQRVGLATADFNLIIDGDNVILRRLGIAATTIRHTAYIDAVQPVPIA